MFYNATDPHRIAGPVTAAARWPLPIGFGIVRAAATLSRQPLRTTGRAFVRDTPDEPNEENPVGGVSPTANPAA